MISNIFLAIDEVLEKASKIRLPGCRDNVVTIARREFTKRGCCDAKFIEPIERTLRECIQQWSSAKKREIWDSTETGIAHNARDDAWEPFCIDMDLESELLDHLIEKLGTSADE
jgi:hypothetical protein